MNSIRVLTNDSVFYFPLVIDGLVSIFCSHDLRLWPGHLMCYNTGLVFYVPPGCILKFHPVHPDLHISMCFRNSLGGIDFCADNCIGMNNNRMIGVCLVYNGKNEFLDINPNDVILRAELIRIINDTDQSLHARIDLYKHFISL